MSEAGKHDKKRLAMVIDVAKCFDCKACMVACKVEYNLPDGKWRNWVRHNGGTTGRRSLFQPGQCMQCDDPSCVAACPVAATAKGPDGVVTIDPERCIGCGNCVTACPYGARYRNTASHKADKCDFCMPRRQRGEEPACVQTCPTNARAFGDLNDPDSRVSRLLKEGKGARIASPGVNAGPNIHYLNCPELLDWAKAPTLPGGIHMPPGFWTTKTEKQDR